MNVCATASTRSDSRLAGKRSPGFMASTACAMSQENVDASIALPFDPQRHAAEVDPQHRAFPGRAPEHARMHKESGASVLLE
jgi:hypothetical protein